MVGLKLSAGAVAKGKAGAYGDGGGLLLVVQPSGAASWILRYRHAGRRRDMGIGPARGLGAVSLLEAREKAAQARRMIREGVDPIDARRAIRKAQKAPARAVPFAMVADRYICAHEAGWRNLSHRQQWRTTLATYAHPHLGSMAVADIGTADVLAVLQPLWATKTETASRLRGRIELVLDYARAHGWRDGENPARWRGHLDKLLPRRSRVAPAQHHAALPWQDVPGFITTLRHRDAVAARAMELLILTAARSGEVLGMRWGEVDLDSGVWTVPAARMKAAKEHRVALSPPAVAVVSSMRPLRTSGDPSEFVFPGQVIGRTLSDMAMSRTLARLGRTGMTIHGFRSAFRDWAGETTAHPREVVEAALAHRVGDAVERAYARGDLFQKRCKLMDDWAAFCASAPADAVPRRPA